MVGIMKIAITGKGGVITNIGLESTREKYRNE
ncbi:hypothetical protein QMG_0643, partial [Clostridioides difficile DA00256]